MSDLENNPILNMTNEQAAEILKMQVQIRFASMGRGNGKTFTNACITHALIKAIDLLEKTPD